MAQSEALNDIKEYRNQKLRDLLAQCTEGQQGMFNRMYGSVETIADECINRAIEQCEATIKKNKAGAQDA